MHKKKIGMWSQYKNNYFTIKEVKLTTVTFLIYLVTDFSVFRIIWIPFLFEVCLGRSIFVLSLLFKWLSFYCSFSHFFLLSSFLFSPFPSLCWGPFQPGLCINTHSATDLNPQPQGQLGWALCDGWHVTCLFIHSCERRLYRLRWGQVLLCEFISCYFRALHFNIAHSKCAYGCSWMPLFCRL